MKPLADVRPSTRLRPRMRSLDRSLAVLVVLSVLLAVVLAALLPLGEPTGALLTLFPVVFLVYVAAGIIAWHRRPSNRLGALIVVAGLSIYLVGLGNSDVAALQLLGDLAGTLPLVVAIHLLHAYPSGRLRGRGSRILVIAGYAGVLVLQPLQVFASRVAADGSADPSTAASIAEAAAGVQTAVGVAVMVGTILLLVLRLRRAEPFMRRVLVPVYSYGVLAIILLRSTTALVDLEVISPPARGVLQLALLAGIPISFVLGVLRGAFAKTGEIEELSTWLSSADGTRGSLQAALARTLGDPTLQLAYWLDVRRVFVDASGRPVADAQPPPVGGPRGHVDIDRDGHRLARIDYDRRTISETGLVQSAGHVVAIAITGEKLTAELHASRNELRESRDRLVDTAERERRRIARDLHDGLQMRLVILALDAQRLAYLPGLPVEARAAGVELRSSIDAAAAELRQVVSHVDPPGLVEGGLAGGLDDLVDRLPLHIELDIDPASERLPATIQRTAYYVVSEALTNVVKHAAADRARVHAELDDGVLRLEIIDDGCGGASSDTDGTGLRGLRDRLDVVGGTLSIVSSSEGTTVGAVIPCA